MASVLPVLTALMNASASMRYMSLSSSLTCRVDEDTVSLLNPTIYQSALGACPLRQMLAKRPSGPLLTQHGANNTKITGFEELGRLSSVQGFPSTMPQGMANTA